MATPRRCPHRTMYSSCHPAQPLASPVAHAPPTASATARRPAGRCRRHGRIDWAGGALSRPAAERGLSGGGGRVRGAAAQAAVAARGGAVTRDAAASCARAAGALADLRRPGRRLRRGRPAAVTGARALATARRDGALRPLVRILGRRRRDRRSPGAGGPTRVGPMPPRARSCRRRARSHAAVVAARAVHGRPAWSPYGAPGRRAGEPYACRRTDALRDERRQVVEACADRRHTRSCGRAARSDPRAPPSTRATHRACRRDTRRAAATACPTIAPAGRDGRAATSRCSPGPTLQLTQAGAHCRPGIQYQRPPLFTPQRP